MTLLAAKDAAEAAEATAIADLAALPTLSQIQATLIDARVGSTMIEVSGGTADITMTLEETSDVSDWSNSTTSQKTFEVTAPAGTSFYRFKMAD
jgi:NADPH-dependent ferric siderophore reductase